MHAIIRLSLGSSSSSPSRWCSPILSPILFILRSIRGFELDSAIILADDSDATPRFAAVRIFFANRAALIGSVLIVLLLMATLLAPWLTPYQPLRESGRALLAP